MGYLKWGGKKGEGSEEREGQVKRGPNYPEQKNELRLRGKTTTTTKNPLPFDVQNPHQ